MAGCGKIRLSRILDRVNELTQAALGDPDFQQRLNAGGFESMSGFGPEQSRRFMRDEYLRWERVVKSAGI